MYFFIFSYFFISLFLYFSTFFYFFLLFLYFCIFQLFDYLFLYFYIFEILYFYIFPPEFSSLSIILGVFPVLGIFYRSNGPRRVGANGANHLGQEQGQYSKEQYSTVQYQCSAVQCIAVQYRLLMPLVLQVIDAHCFNKLLVRLA